MKKKNMSLKLGIFNCTSSLVAKLGERQEEGNIKAFKTFGPYSGLKSYVGTRDLFEFEALTRPNEQNQFLLRVQHSGCGFAKYLPHRIECAREDSDIVSCQE
jgi:hypothetical protein